MHPEALVACLLWTHCRMHCQIVAHLGTPHCWRVDTSDGRTTLMSGSTLLVMAEKRLPASMWADWLKVVNR